MFLPAVAKARGRDQLGTTIKKRFPSMSRKKNCGGKGSPTLTSAEISPDLRVPFRPISASRLKRRRQTARLERATVHAKHIYGPEDDEQACARRALP